MAQKSGPDDPNCFLKYCEIAKLAIFAPNLDLFCKNGSSDHIHASTFVNRVSFFQQGSILSGENVFRANKYD